MINKEINSIVSALKNAGAKNVENYEKKLSDNSFVEDNIKDLLAEGYAALMFLNNKFKVTMRESPDLKIKLKCDIAYVEVKHFRQKENDRKDEMAMKATNSLVRVSNITPFENREPWEQIVDVAIKAAVRNQFIQKASNLLVIQTDRNAISGIYLTTAINCYNDLASQSKDQHLRDLNAIILMDKKYYPGGQIEELIGDGSRNVILFQLASFNTPLGNCMLRALKRIRLWW